MSTAVITQPASRLRLRAAAGITQGAARIAFPTLFTPLAFAVHGYHPFAEDGGLYAAGIKHLIDPALYPHSIPFVTAHLQFSLFAPGVAALVRMTHLGLEIMLLGLHLACIWVTLLAVWMLAERCFRSRSAHVGAVLLFAAWLTVPVAGTSIILMDPYVTARSISLPCTLLAWVAMLDLLRPEVRPLRSIVFGMGALLLAAMVHPLMAAYALGSLLLLAAAISPVRRWAAPSLCVVAFLVASVLYLGAAPDKPDYTQAALSRTYWFLSQWQWYEIVGVAAPLLIVVGLLRMRRISAAHKALLQMALWCGVTAIVICLIFAHAADATYVVARLQPLRIFQAVYVVMMLSLGALLGELVLRCSAVRTLVAFALLAAPFLYAGLKTYPSSAHIEWPGATPANAWEQAFVWIRHNTPVDALFALDAHYISLAGEDAQCFRVLAERSALPDFSKDGGETAIAPALTEAWVAGQRAQDHLSEETDTERLAALQPLHVGWMVLQAQARTRFACPYRNAQVQVCRLP